MNTSILRTALIFPVAALSFAGLALAQDDAADAKPARPMHIRPQWIPDPDAAVQPAVTLPTWNGSFVYSGHTYNYNMVGTAPSSNATTTIPVYIIPLKIVITSSGGTKTTFDAEHVLTNGRTVIQNTVDSPIFDATTTYTQGGVNVGTTQYIDAFQRANFWGTVSSNPNYHLILGGPTVLAEQTLNPSSRQGKTGKPFGFTVAEVSYSWIDGQIRNMIKKFTQVNPGTLPIFIAYNTYLTSGGCCIGGYHNGTGAQSYSFSSYIDQVGQFAQDVSALSHEIGEWADDPIVNNSGNPVACGILEVGDPLENNPNFGGYPYTVNGFQYNLQDLVTLPYFGAPPSTSVNNFFTFQGESLSVCQNGG